MKSREIAVCATTFATLLLAGCGEKAAREDDSVDKCRGNGTNVIPTYVASDEKYNPDTDPAVLKRLQEEAVKAGTYSHGVYGIGTLVCKVGVGEGNWFNNEPSEWQQVLTQRAIELANSTQR